MNALNIVNNIVRAAGLLALLIGLAASLGQFYGLLNIHVAFGATVVLGLSGFSVLALTRGEAISLALSGLVWAALTVALGLGQTKLITGDQHWIIQILHICLGLGAVMLTSKLATLLKQGTTSRQQVLRSTD